MAKEYQEGFATVTGPREMLTKYWPMKFADALAAAERGDDGLTVTSGQAYAAENTFILRKLDTKGSKYHGQCGLLSQGW